MDLYTVSRIYALFVLTFIGRAEGQDEPCSARQQSEVQRAGRVYCKDACQSTSECRSPRECICDGVCGLSCINTVKNNYCPSIATPTSSQLIVLDKSFGGIARYLCIPGYELLSGDLSRRCRGDRTWSGLPPNCVIPVPCDILHIQRGTIEYNPPLSPNYAGVPSDTQATYQCNEGLQFEVPGTGTRRCEHGMWTSLVPRCVEKPCAKFSEEPGDHWTITYSPTFSSNQASVSHEAVATFSCDNGYRGDVMFKTCNRGSWSRDLLLPVCTPVTENYCSFIATPISSELIFLNKSFGGIARYLCIPGHELMSGDLSRRCRGDTTWSGLPPNCVIPVSENYCSSIATPTSSELIFFDKRVIGGIARYVCIPGYELMSGDLSRRCRGDRTWSGLPPNCVIIAEPCAKILEEPGDPWTVTYSPTLSSNQVYVSHEAVATFTCDNGYRNDVMFKTCIRGSWSPDLLPPVCNPACPRPSTSTDLQQFINDAVNLEQDTRQEFPIGTYIISRCTDPGKKSLVPADSVRRECTNGEWTRQQPTCESFGVKIFIRGSNIRQLRNNGTLVIQALLGTVEIDCQSFDTYPVFRAPHIIRVQQNAVNGKGSKRYRRYSLGTPQPQDSGLFSCRRYSQNSPVISLHIQVKDARCPDPGIPQNGHREGDDFNMNREVTFSCQQGYTSEGASSITCNFGEWSDGTPTCRPDQCPHYTLNDDNVRELAGSGYHHGAIRIFQCREGFTNANGQTGVTSECMDNGQWSPEPLQCNVISQLDNPCATKECEVWETCVDGTCYCLKPNQCPQAAADDLVCGSDNREYASVCHLKATACFFRRPITVERFRESCPEDVSSVVDARCPDPGIPQNGHREGDDFNMNREVTFSCQQGYTLEGASSITCNFGEWSDGTPTCRLDQCPHYTLNDDNVRELAGSGHHHGAIRIFQCREGFTNSDGETGVTSECMDNGQWSPELLQCNVILQPDNPTANDPCATKECEVWEECVDGTCYCLKPNQCPQAATDDLVCGSDNREYASVCHLKATACFFRRPITVERIGEPCSEDFGSLSSTLNSDVSPEDEALVPPEIDPPIDESG